MTYGFIDLDELILQCRDLKAKEYISDAVLSYRAGSYRASIVSTWIAICFDIIEKIRELSLAGDKQAEQLYIKIEQYRLNDDIANSLKFEREILETCKEKFELISPVEYIDLKRIQEDRNRCAHPSLSPEDQVFNPSAELARVHIRSAITHLLAHPPIQGKFALDRLISDVDSEYFPQNYEKALTVLRNGPLKKPRQSLVSNFLIILMKKLLSKETRYPYTRKYGAAILAIKILQPEWFESTVKVKVPSLLKNITDDEIYLIKDFFEFIPSSWEYIDDGCKHRFEIFVEKFPNEYFDDIDFFLDFKPLRKSIIKRIKSSQPSDYLHTIFFITPPEVINRFIKGYLNSHTYENANEWSKLISIYLSDFTKENIIEIISGMKGNSQITGSFEINNLIRKIKSSDLFEQDEINEIFTNNGLSNF